MLQFKKASLCLCLLILTLAVLNFIDTLFSLNGWLTRQPQWDPSAHALDSIHFARAFLHLSPWEFLVQLHNSAMWPPIIPLLQAPFHMIFGPSLMTARVWTAFTSLPAVLLTFGVGYYAHKTWGLLVGAIAASLLFVSPVFQEHALQEMLEIPAISLFSICLICYLRYLNSEHQEIRYWKATCISGTVLFFAKFNYAVLAMLPIMVNELVLRPEFRELLKRAFLEVWRQVNWKGGFTIFVVLYLCFLIYVQKVGLRFEIFSQTVVMEKAFGNPLYLLVLILLIRNAVVHPGLLKRYRNNVMSAGEPIHSFLRWTFFPAALWMCYPVFFMHFFLYMFNEKTRQSSFFSMETLSFYPGAVIQQYSPAPWIGIVCLLCLALGLILMKRWTKVERFLIGLATFNLLLTMTHPNYQVRYLMTFIPLLFLVAGIMIVRFIGLVFAGRQGADKVAWLVAPLLILGLCLSFPADQNHLQIAFNKTSQDEQMKSVFEAICRESIAGKKNTVIGFSNYVSPSAIALVCYEKFPLIQRSQLPTAMGRLGFPNEKSGKRIVEAESIDRFFLIDYQGFYVEPGRLQESFLLNELTSALKESPYEKISLIPAENGGVGLTVFRKQSSSELSH